MSTVGSLPLFLQRTSELELGKVTEAHYEDPNIHPVQVLLFTGDNRIYEKYYIVMVL